jgi:hypothetical protein
MNEAFSTDSVRPARSSSPSLVRSSRAFRWLRSIAGLALATAWSPTASGQQVLDQDADAERLFREGQKLMEERRFGEACPKFEAAYRKDQQLGTLLNLAYCHKAQGAVWQSWLEFKEAEVKAIDLKRNDRRDFARQRMAELEKSLARVVIDPTDKVELTEVLVEDRRVPEAEKGQIFAAEPGQRKLTFRAKGKKQVVQLIHIEKGDRPQRIAVPDMVDEEEPVVVAPAEVARETITTPVTREVTSPDRSRGTVQRIVGLATAGVGAVGLTVGSIYGLRTLYNECTDGKPAYPNVPGRPSCTGEQHARYSETGAISTVAFIAGGVLVAGGLVLYFTAPSSRSSAAVGGAAHAPDGPGRAGLRVLPEIGGGWAGVRGVF